MLPPVFRRTSCCNFSSPFQDLVKDWNGCQELWSTLSSIKSHCLHLDWCIWQQLNCLSSVMSFVLNKLVCVYWKSLFGAAWSVFAFLSCSKTFLALFLFSCSKPSCLSTTTSLILFRLEKTKSRLMFLHISVFPLNLGGTHVCSEMSATTKITMSL